MVRNKKNTMRLLKTLFSGLLFGAIGLYLVFYRLILPLKTGITYSYGSGPRLKREILRAEEPFRFWSEVVMTGGVLPFIFFGLALFIVIFALKGDIELESFTVKRDKRWWRHFF